MLDTGTYRVRVTPTGTTDVAIDTGPLDIGSDVVLTAIAFDAPGGGTPFAISVFVDNATQVPAHVRVIHGSPDAPAVDVLLDGEVVLTNVPYLAASDYLAVAAGEHNIQVRASGTETTVIDTDVTVEADVDYTVIATDFVASITPVILVDDRTLPGEGLARVRVGHGAPSAPNVDVYVTAPDGELVDPVLTDVPFQVFSDYLMLDTGTYRVRVTPTGTTDVAIDTGPLDIGSDVVLTAIVDNAGS
jgi:hypothetical protein